MKHWVEVQQNSLERPVDRSEHSHSLYNDNFYIFGGEKTNLSKLDDFYEFDMKTNTWKVVQTHTFGPTRRGAHASVQHKDDFYIFGGFDSNNLECGDLWKFSFKTREWIHLKTQNTPSFRHYHTLNVHENYLVLFAGHSGSGLFFNDLQFYDIQNYKWITKTPHKFQRYGHKSVIYKDKLYVFGGHIKSNEIDQISNDLIEYDFKKDVWKDCFSVGQPPSPRKSHGCCVVNDSLFVYGSTSDDQVHEYSFLEKRWYNYDFLKKPMSRFGHCMIPQKESFLVYGGYNNEINNSFGTIFEFKVGKNRCTLIKHFDQFYSKSLDFSDVLIETINECETPSSPPVNTSKKRKRGGSGNKRKKIKS
eukprot:gene3148-5464_t